MKIIKLTAENVKRVQAVEIEPTGNMVEITGMNRQGKTSVLDAIAMVLQGASAIPAEPIRKGQNKAQIVLNLGTAGEPDKQVIVTRKFMRGTDKAGAERITTDLIFEAASGARFGSPQKMADELYGAFTLDPVAFIDMADADKVTMLKRFVPGVDFDAIDGQNRKDYEARTDENRDARTKRAQAAGVIVPEGTPEAPVDVDSLIAQVAEAGEHNARIEAAKVALIVSTEHIETCRRLAAEERDSIVETVADIQRTLNDRLTELQEQIDNAKNLAVTLKGKAEREAEERAGRYEEEAREQKAGLPALQERAAVVAIDAESIKAQITAARIANENVAAAARKSQLEREAKGHEDKAQALTDAMEAREKAKAEAIAKAEIPVPGIGFGMNKKDQRCITLNGVPFDQASGAEQLEAAIRLAMAQNPKLRVIRVRDANGMDPNAMRQLAELAEKNDCQVWCESVRSVGRMAFVIEDGRVKNAPAEPADADPAPLL